MRIRSAAFALLVPMIALSMATSLMAQQEPIGNAQRSMVSRAELRATLDTIERLTGSPGYSTALRRVKQAEADILRERLADGDFHTGDLVKIEVIGDPSMSATYQISATRTITIAGGAEIPVKGVLRSEMQDYMTQQFKAYVRDPLLKVTSAIRISIFGAVAKPGFVQAPSTALLSEVLMVSAGGVANNMQEEKSKIKRGDRVVVDGADFKTALHTGMTLDQLNVEAGDEIFVAAKPASALFWRILSAATALGGLVWLAFATHVI